MSTSSRRLKPISLLVGLALGGATLLTWTMPWFVVYLTAGVTGQEAIEVPGDIAAPALAALGLAGLALVAALAIAGPLFRVVLGVLEVGIGVCVFLSAWGAISNPVTAAAPLVSETTGISGAESVRTLIESATATAWPATACALGAATVMFGVFLTATASRWPTKANRYQAVHLESADEPRTAVSDWDSLSDGDDPTSR